MSQLQQPYETEWMIDLTSMKHIVNYLNLDNSIEGIVHVKDEDLGRIGDLFLTESGTAEDVKTLLESRKIDFWKHPNDVTIPITNCVDCIRAEPYYLVKDLRKPYI